MFFKRFYDDALAQASYMIGCQRTGEALVVDPNRNVEQYLEAAAEEQLRLTQVTETHIHADFVSGARELASRAGAHLLLSREGGPDWQYGFAKQSGATLLGDGDSFMVGNIRVDVLHTPGHTPEHLSFLITDTPASEQPWGILTGDFVFVGDVGRPDLLERAAGYANTMEAGARTLFHSLERFRALPDFVQVWPGHGAGSACGKALGAVPSSTVGYEKLANWGVSTTDEATFVRSVLEGQPDPPVYFAEMKRINRDGPPILGESAEQRAARLPRQAAELDDALRAGATVIDTRPAAVYARGLVQGTLNIPFNSSFTGWAGWLVPYDRDIYLIVDEAVADAANVLRELSTIGLDRVVGIFGADVFEGRTLETVPQADASEVAALMDRDAVQVIDVRNASEYAAGHLPHVPNIPLGRLASRIAELPADKPVVLHCQGGGRSSIAASLLRAHGVRDVINMTGGFAGWRRAGLPVTES